MRAATDGEPAARKPKATMPPAGTEPRYEALRTVIAEPLVVGVPFPTWVTAWPLPSVQPTVQPLTAALPAVTVASPGKPPGHEPAVR